MEASRLSPVSPVRAAAGPLALPGASLPPDPLQPSQHGPGRLQILVVVREDLVHQLSSRPRVVGFGRLNELRDRPVAAALVLRPSEPDVLFDDFEAVARQRECDGIFGDCQQINKIAKHPAGDAVRVPDAVRAEIRDPV